MKYTLSFLLLLSTLVNAQGIFAPALKPTGILQNDAQPVTTALKFTVDKTGYIDSIGFYKQAGNNAAHTGNLWDSSGKLLATVLFSGETATGWQFQKLTVPVQVFSGFNYYASIFNTSGLYSETSNYFTTIRGFGHLIGLNSAYSYGTGVTFPKNNFQKANYWIDVTYKLTNTGCPVIGDTLQPIINVDFNHMSHNDSIAVAGAYRALFPHDTAFVHDTTIKVIHDTTNIPPPVVLKNLLYPIILFGFKLEIYANGWILYVQQTDGSFLKSKASNE